MLNDGIITCVMCYMCPAETVVSLVCIKLLHASNVKMINARGIQGAWLPSHQLLTCMRGKGHRVAKRLVGVLWKQIKHDSYTWL